MKMDEYLKPQFFEEIAMQELNKLELQSDVASETMKSLQEFLEK